MRPEPDAEESARLAEAGLALAAFEEALADLVRALAGVKRPPGVGPLAAKLLRFQSIVARGEGDWSAAEEIRRMTPTEISQG